ncbi:MAG: hypothetical protein AAGI44_03020 [Pseudomonadota bacterium]
MDQSLPEDIYDALQRVTPALGGPKKMGCMLWPTITDPEKARRRYSDCLNENHAQKFSIDELLMILREARRVGVHDGMHYLAAFLGYSPPAPLEPEGERQALMRRFIHHMERAESMASDLRALHTQLADELD